MLLTSWIGTLRREYVRVSKSILPAPQMTHPANSLKSIPTPSQNSNFCGIRIPELNQPRSSNP